jgi:hypothetical protein
MNEPACIDLLDEVSNGNIASIDGAIVDYDKFIIRIVQVFDSSERF